MVEQSSSCDVSQRATTSLIVVINNQACALIDGLCTFVICEILHLECLFSWTKKNDGDVQYICVFLIS